MINADVALRVHLVRHGQVASHRGNLPLTEEGRRQMDAAGQRFAQALQAGEVVSILHAPTRRTAESASRLYESLQRRLDETGKRQIHLLTPAEEQAIRNPDIYVAGARVEMVSSAEALAEQVPASGLVPDELAQLAFWRGFWSDPDRIGFWVGHPDPPGEDADTVARRLLTFAASQLDLPRTQPRRYICVTHSPLLRAFLRRYLFGYDPGEPAYAESIDLAFTSDGTLTIHYLDGYKKVER
jgi:broad specificity phosphatase PhoE